MKKLTIGIALLLLMSYQSNAQDTLETAAPDTSVIPPIFPGDTLELPADTSGIPINATAAPGDTLQPTEQAAPQVKVPNQVYGTFTEIKKTNGYDPRAVAKELNKGKYGHPINVKKDSLHWKKGGLLALNINQGSLQNWSAGGDNFSLSLGAVANLYANYAKGRQSWDNNLDMAFGYLNTSSLGTRKSDDKISLYSKYGLQFSKSWFYSAMISFRSQFANGYLYPDDSNVVSHFLAPAYLLGSIGFDFKPASYFSLFLSPLTSRFVIVADQRMADQGAYGVDSARYQYLPGNTRLLLRHGTMIRYELGAFTSITFNKEILKNISWNTRLDLYSNYLHNPRNIDVYWTSVLNLKVNKYITASINTELIYDDDIKFVTYATDANGHIQKNPETGENIVLKRTPRIQFKELVGLGFAYQF